MRYVRWAGPHDYSLFRRRRRRKSWSTAKLPSLANSRDLTCVAGPAVAPFIGSRWTGLAGLAVVVHPARPYTLYDSTERVASWMPCHGHFGPCARVVESDQTIAGAPILQDCSCGTQYIKLSTWVATPRRCAPKRTSAHAVSGAPGTTRCRRARCQISFGLRSDQWLSASGVMALSTAAQSVDECRLETSLQSLFPQLSIKDRYISRQDRQLRSGAARLLLADDTAEVPVSHLTGTVTFGDETRDLDPRSLVVGRARGNWGEPSSGRAEEVHDD